MIVVVLQGVGSQSLWNLEVRTGFSRRPWLWDEHRGLLYLMSDWYLPHWYFSIKIWREGHVTLTHQMVFRSACVELSVPFIKKIYIMRCLSIFSLSRESHVTKKPQMVLQRMRQVLGQFSKTICTILLSLARARTNVMWHWSKKWFSITCAKCLVQSIRKCMSWGVYLSPYTCLLDVEDSLISQFFDEGEN